MERFDRIAQRKYEDYARTQLQKIEVVPGLCRWNFRCMMNAVHDAINNSEKEIAMVIYIDNGCPIIHFINISREKGKEVFTDNTLGAWAVQYDYFLVKRIQESEFWEVGVIFDKFRDQLYSKLSWWERLFTKFKA